MSVRAASHAGSWYTNDGDELDSQLSRWLKDVNGANVPAPHAVHLDGAAAAAAAAAGAGIELPVRGCRAIIGPHAGYSYSGPAAAWAYRCIDTAGVKRVFVLGPSHHVYLDGCAVTVCDTYETPIGSLPIDKPIVEELAASRRFSRMSLQTDEDEHSIEMHLPYIRKVFEGRDITIVPILVGSISVQKEAYFGELLAPYLRDPANFFVVSSDFCHWGTRFSYTYYNSPSAGSPIHLSSRIPPDPTQPIHASIRALDGDGILAISYNNTGGTQTKTAAKAAAAFAKYLSATKNTVCGRHPIGVLLGALAALEGSEGKEGEGWGSECRFTRYEQSSACESVRDSSVSYASAFVRFA